MRKVALISFDEKSKKTKSIRGHGRKLVINELPVEALRGIYGMEYPDKYIIPFFAKGDRNNT